MDLFGFDEYDRVFSESSRWLARLILMGLATPVLDVLAYDSRE